MAEKTPQELIQIDLTPPPKRWMNPAVDFEARRGTWSYPTAVKNLNYLGMPNAREWSPADADWKLPDNWKQIVLEGMAERLSKYRAFKVFMDSCVRCGACWSPSTAHHTPCRRAHCASAGSTSAPPRGAASSGSSPTACGSSTSTRGSAR